MKPNNQFVNLLLLSAAACSRAKKGMPNSRSCSNPQLKRISSFRIESDNASAGTTGTTTSATGSNNYNNYNNYAMDSAGDASMMPPLLAALYAADNATNLSPDATGPFELPPLEYDYDALEPYIDEQTLRVHHQGHHKTYVDNLNAVLSRHPEFYNSTLHELLLFPDRLPSDIQTQVINNGGGVYNHSLMWKVIGPANKSRPTGEFSEAINRQFGSFENLRRNLKAAGESVFGSGYAYLVLNPYGRLLVITTSNQNTPIPLRMIPLLPIDVWEHAYYLKHQNKRSNYLDDYFNLIDWDRVGDRFRAASEAFANNDGSNGAGGSAYSTNNNYGTNGTYSSYNNYGAASGGAGSTYGTTANGSGSSYGTNAGGSGTNYGTNAGGSGSNYGTNAGGSGTNYGTNAVGSGTNYGTNVGGSGTNYGTNASGGSGTNYGTNAGGSGTNYGTASGGFGSNYGTSASGGSGTNYGTASGGFGSNYGTSASGGSGANYGTNASGGSGSSYGTSASGSTTGSNAAGSSTGNTSSSNASGNSNSTYSSNSTSRFK